MKYYSFFKKKKDKKKKKKKKKRRAQLKKKCKGRNWRNFEKETEKERGDMVFIGFLESGSGSGSGWVAVWISFICVLIMLLLF
jgi:hypothetical protein